MAVDDSAVVGPESRPLFRVAFRPVWILLGLVVLFHLGGLSVSIPVRYGVLLLTVVVLGLPHGAVDHLIIPRALDTRVTGRSLAIVGLLYLVLGGVYGVLWFVAPVAGFVLFILLTWFHWGQGDLYPLQAFSAGYPCDRIGALLVVTVRGALPMLVPLVFFPERYQAVATIIVGLFDTGATAVLSAAFTPTARVAVAGGVGLLTVTSLAWGYVTAGNTRGWRIDFGETVLLWLFFAVVPPVLAIGLYFSVWHSVRHILRVSDLRSPLTTDGPSLSTHVRQFLVDATPMSLGALLLFGLLIFVVPHDPENVEQVAGAYLVLLAVLTLPHVVIVTWLDRRQSVWGE